MVKRVGRLDEKRSNSHASYSTPAPLSARIGAIFGYWCVGESTKARIGIEEVTVLASARVLLLVSLLGFAAGHGQARAQENLDRGRSPAQLYASDCAECHRNPKAVGRTMSSGSLAGFLREHYTASRESAAALAGYLSAMAPDPAAAPSRASGRAATSAAKPSTAKPSDTRPSEERTRPSASGERIGPEGQIAAPAGKPHRGATAKPAEPVNKPAEPVSEPKTSTAPEPPQPPAAIPEPAAKPPESEAKPPPGDAPN